MIKASSGGSGSKGVLPSSGRITVNSLYTCELEGNYRVICIGGGGGAGSGYVYRDRLYYSTYGFSLSNGYVWGGGGGSGYVNSALIHLNYKEQIEVTIGSGGSSIINTNGGTGGTTSFGTYLYATGGGGGDTPYGANSNNRSEDLWYTNGGIGFVNGTNCMDYWDSRGSGNNSQKNFIGSGGRLYYYTNINGVTTVGSYSINSFNTAVNLVYNGIPRRLFFGDGGDPSKTSPYLGGSGSHGCVIIEYIN